MPFIHFGAKVHDFTLSRNHRCHFICAAMPFYLCWHFGSDFGPKRWKAKMPCYLCRHRCHFICAGRCHLCVPLLYLRPLRCCPCHCRRCAVSAVFAIFLAPFPPFPSRRVNRPPEYKGVLGQRSLGGWISESHPYIRAPLIFRHRVFRADFNRNLESRTLYKGVG